MVNFHKGCVARLTKKSLQETQMYEIYIFYFTNDIFCYILFWVVKQSKENLFKTERKVWDQMNIKRCEYKTSEWIFLRRDKNSNSMSDLYYNYVHKLFVKFWVFDLFILKERSVVFTVN